MDQLRDLPLSTLRANDAEEIRKSFMNVIAGTAFVFDSWTNATNARDWPAQNALLHSIIVCFIDPLAVIDRGAFMFRYASSSHDIQSARIFAPTALSCSRNDRVPSSACSSWAMTRCKGEFSTLLGFSCKLNSPFTGGQPTFQTPGHRLGQQHPSPKFKRPETLLLRS